MELIRLSWRKPLTGRTLRPHEAFSTACPPGSSWYYGNMGVRLMGVSLSRACISGLHLIEAYISQDVHVRCVYFIGVTLKVCACYRRESHT